MASTMTAPLLPRERMLAALAFRPVDVIPLLIHPSPGGLFEHGRKLLDLMRSCGHDFDDLSQVRLPEVPTVDFDPDGRYHRIAADEWGTTWEYRIFGIWGHRVRYPLLDLSRLATWKPPPIARLAGEELSRARAAAEVYRRTYFHLTANVSLFETMQNLRPFDDVLVDIAQDTPEINRLADLLMEYYSVMIANALAVGADAIAVFDDFGTQQALMMSPKVWRRFFAPRYRALFDPVVKAGESVFFHSCGSVGPLLEDLRAAGAVAVWPQLPLFDLRDLARRCRALGLAVQMQPDRGDLMQRRGPGEVRDHVRRLVDTFETLSGGSWLHIEIDPGFPWENVRALFETAMDSRRRA
jgi:hypothetical protein